MYFGVIYTPLSLFLLASCLFITLANVYTLTNMSLYIIYLVKRILLLLTTTAKGKTCYLKKRNV